MRARAKKIKQQLLSEMNNKREGKKTAPVDKARQRMMEISGDVPDKRHIKLAFSFFLSFLSSP